MPDIHLTFACHQPYFELVKGHPYLDEVIDVRNFKRNDYMLSYDITACCIMYESRVGPSNTKHRAEIWAEHCGIPLQNTDMNLPFISQQHILDGRLALNQLRKASLSSENKDGPSALICPKAFERLRSLDEKQIVALVTALRKKGLFVYATHTHEIPVLKYLKVPLLNGETISQWMGFIHAADYVATVDTSCFHYAGGIGKPLLGIFTHVDGKLRGKYYNFVLVQKHRDNGNWPCGPCYNYLKCSNPNCTDRSVTGLRPCQTELSSEEIEEGVEKMVKKWTI